MAAPHPPLRFVFRTEGYTFRPPQPGLRWYRAIQPTGPLVKRFVYGITGVRVVGGAVLQGLVRAGKSVLLVANHARYADPAILIAAGKQTSVPLHFMAAWELFAAHGGFDGWFMGKMGAFSVDRFGMDRAALSAAVGILAGATRPLVVFPEGTVYGLADRVGPFMDGFLFMARQAARRRAEAGGDGEVVLLPTVLRYHLPGDRTATFDRLTARIERRLGLPRGTGLPWPARFAVIGHAMLEQAERVASLPAETAAASPAGADPRWRGTVVQDGRVTRDAAVLPDLVADFESRRRAFIAGTLDRLETDVQGRPQAGDIVVRVRRLQTALMAGLVDAASGPELRRRREGELADLSRALAAECYPADYLTEFDPVPTGRLAETVEKLAYDVLGEDLPQGPMSATVSFGQPRVVRAEEPAVPRGAAGPALELQAILRDGLRTAAAAERLSARR